MNDKNIRTAASMQIIGGIALGAGIGYAASGWFQMSAGLCVIVGVVVGFLLANVLIFQYGGRSTR